MSISKPPSARTSVAPDDIKDRVPSADDRVPGTRNEPEPHPPSGSGVKLAIQTFVWLVLIGLATAGWFYREAWWPKVAPFIGLAAKPPKKPTPRVVPVVTAIAQQKDMDVFINGLGTVTAFKTVTIRSRVEGELVKVAFTEGQMVSEGDLLAEIDRRPFDVQLQQAEGQLARDEATLKTAEFTYKRYQELAQSKSIAPQQVDEQRSLVQQMSGAIQSDQGSVANARLQLDYCHIIAPISGRIGLRLVDQGNIVRANDPNGLAVITQLQPIALVFTIPQDDISRVQKASRDGRELVVTAYDRDFKMKLATGKLLAIDNQVDATTGTVRLKAIFDNEDGLLFPNQFVNARLLVGTKKNATVVPTAAVQRGPSFIFVYVVQSDDTVELRNVTVGLAEGAATSIESGLSPGEVVVTEGLDKLQKGSKITTVEKEKVKELEREKDKDKDANKNKNDGNQGTGKKSGKPKDSDTEQKSDTEKKPDTEKEPISAEKVTGEKTESPSQPDTKGAQ